jgi:hypothetical protein
MGGRVRAVRAAVERSEVTTLKVVPWTWRDGSVHLEMRLCSFHEGDTLLTHLDGGDGRFVTACGKGWWGIGSSCGLGHTQNVSCEDCRTILRGMGEIEINLEGATL